MGARVGGVVGVGTDVLLPSPGPEFDTAGGFAACRADSGNRVRARRIHSVYHGHELGNDGDPDAADHSAQLGCDERQWHSRR